jgi:acyl dehydratase
VSEASSVDRAAAPTRLAPLDPGTELPGLDVGPFTLSDFVRWAGYQENWLRIHYDRAYAAQRAGVSDCIQSGHHRTALLIRMITDWMGTRGHLVRIAVRHTAPVFPGDSIRCRGRIRNAAPADGQVLIELDVVATTADERLVSEGTAAVRVTAPATGGILRTQP